MGICQAVDRELLLTAIAYADINGCSYVLLYDRAHSNLLLGCILRIVYPTFAEGSEMPSYYVAGYLVVVQGFDTLRKVEEVLRVEDVVYVVKDRGILSIIVEDLQALYDVFRAVGDSAALELRLTRYFCANDLGEVARRAVLEVLEE